MPRTELITTEKLFELLDKYCYEKNPWKIKVSEFGTYVRTHGFPNVEDYLIRRHRPVMDEIKSRNNPAVKDYEFTIAAYLPLDIGVFLRQNNTLEKLSAALTTREAYYANLAKSAGKALKEKKDFITERQELQKKISELENKLSASQKTKKENEELKKENKMLRNLMNETVNPAIANELLYAHGIVLTRDGITAPDKVDNLVSLSSDINALKAHLTETLLLDLDISEKGGNSNG